MGPEPPTTACWWESRPCRPPRPPETKECPGAIIQLRLVGWPNGGIFEEGIWLFLCFCACDLQTYNEYWPTRCVAQ